jgi:enoyl-CoA hydratase
MAFTQVLYEVVGRVARVSMNRPRYKNAQSFRMLEELDEAFRRAADDPDVRVIVLRGEGETFSAGHDLGTDEQLADLRGRSFGGDDLYSKLIVNWKEMQFALQWRDIPKPTIAAVQGYCIFNAWITMSMMDVVFAAEDAQFMPSAPSGPARWDIGARKAKEILFRRRFISAQEAEALGFVNRVVPTDRLDAEVMAYANEVAEGDPADLWIAKLAVNSMLDAQGFTNDIRHAYALARALLGSRAASESSPRRGDRIRSREVQRVFDRDATSEQRETEGEGR